MQARTAFGAFDPGIIHIMMAPAESRNLTAKHHFRQNNIHHFQWSSFQLPYRRPDKNNIAFHQAQASLCEAFHLGQDKISYRCPPSL